MITPLDRPMDPLDDMTPEEARALEDWEDHFRVWHSLFVLTGRPSIFLLEY